MGVGMNMGGSKTKESSESKTESWLLNQLKPLITQSINSATGYQDQLLAGLTDEQKEALEALSTGSYTTQAQQDARWLQEAGLASLASGQGILDEARQNYYNTMEQYTGQNYQNLVNSYYNSDIVNQQIGIAERKVNEQVASGVQQLNQQAVASGNIGSSRAGVSEGVLRAKGAEALGDTTANIQAGMYNTALGAAQAQAEQALYGAARNPYAEAGINQINQGYNLFNTASNNLYGIAANNVQNQLAAGEYYQAWNQQQLDNDYYNQLMASNPALYKLQTLLPVIGGTAGWSTTTKGSSQASSFNWGLSAQFGNSSGAGTSDARLKDDIETIEEALTIEVDGALVSFPRIVKWKWNDLALKVFEERGIKELPATTGVIAQELEETNLYRFVVYAPTEVEGLDKAYRMVDYTGLISFAKDVGLIDEGE